MPPTTRGGDAYSLYAFLHQSQCAQAASSKGYDNITGGINARQHGQSLRLMTPHISAMPIPCSPRRNHQRKAIIGKGGIPVTRKIDPLPELDLSFFEKNWGKASSNGSLMMGRKKKKNEKPS